MTDQPRSSRTRSDRSLWVAVDPSEDPTRPPPLTRARTVRAAMRLVDEQGLQALTMRALATELKVSPMALYNHVRDKEELIDLMLDLMLGEADISATEGDWLTQLRTLVRNVHQTLSAHHHLARMYGARVTIGPHGLAIIERVLKLLLEAGFPPRDAAAAFMTLYTYTVGIHQIGSIAPVPGPTPQGEADYYQALPPEQIPSIHTASAYLRGVRQPEDFEYGLDTLLAGLKTKLTR